MLYERLHEARINVHRHSNILFKSDHFPPQFVATFGFCKVIDEQLDECSGFFCTPVGNALFAYPLFHYLCNEQRADTQKFPGNALEPVQKIQMSFSMLQRTHELLDRNICWLPVPENRSHCG